MKQGGVSWNTSFRSKKAMKTRSKCQYCFRQYKQDWTKNSHESSCKEYNYNDISK